MENLSYLPDWVKKGIIYHIYPLGFCNAPIYGSEDPNLVPRLVKIRDFYTHFESMGINIIQFGPIFESISHGYDTTDFMNIDHRLGTNGLFKEIVQELHAKNIKVIVDGVFNHVGREFASFKDVQQYQQKSWRKHWHYLDFSKNNPNNDGFDYKNWEGHYSLVNLNLEETDVKEYLFSVARYWLQDIGIDGWRLDVAYQIPVKFWQEFRNICKQTKPECVLIGEMIHGPYSKWVGSDRLDVGTGYQIHKSIWSAFNSNNLYELKAVLEQSFHPQWGLNKDICLMNFLGNHDTNRIYSQLIEKNQIYPAFLFLFTTNGIPKIYYGDEVGLEGMKTTKSDEAVRKSMPSPSQWSKIGVDILNHVKKCIQMRKNHHALQYGTLTSLSADAHTLSFLRQSSQETILIILSTSSETCSYTVPLWNLNLNGKKFVEQLSQGGEKEYLVHNSQLFIPQLYPNWGRILRMEE